MKVGAAQVEITPETGGELCGFAARTQPSIGILDPLFAKALYKESGGRLLHLHADLIGLTKSFADDVRTNLAEELGLSRKEILVSVTHTHSGPGTVPLSCAGEFDPNYLDGLKIRFLEISRNSIQCAEEAIIWKGSIELDTAVERTLESKSKVKQAMTLTGYRKPNGEWLAAEARFGMHPVWLGSKNRMISGDWPGRLSQQIAERLEGRPPVLCLNRACGNLDPPSLNVEPREIDTWASLASEKVLSNLRQAEDGPFDSVALVIDLPLEVLSSAELDRNVEELESNDFAKSEWGPNYLDALKEWHVNRTNDTRTDFALPVQIVRHADQATVFIGAEPFFEMSEAISRLSGLETEVIGYANGLIGYLATRDAYERKTYETELAHIFYNSWRLKPEAFEIACHAFANRIDSL